MNHDILGKGLYVSRMDGDIITYDLRMALPNKGPYLENDGIHTFEHLFATYVRNTDYYDDIIYVGPMGCRTGFYFLTRDHLRKEAAIALIQDTMRFIKDFKGAISGAQEPRECGNIQEHNLAKANAYAADYLNVINEWTIADLEYPQE